MWQYFGSDPFCFFARRALYETFLSFCSAQVSAKLCHRSNAPTSIVVTAL
jgi:hypothetical protein